ncbi:MAG: metal ABC transporter ATP-binding protein [Lactobacillales bacterium]|jgi:zinc transport system ATP-binding protein|nr:metal ABC transporter ATP-binding protein [Lactobacillales bacterium]
MRIIDVENLTFYYDNNPVLEDVSYHIDSGQFVTLTGENGSAKSTLVKATLGLLKPAKGTVTIAKKNLAGRKLNIGYVSQTISSFNAGFPSTVYELVSSGRYKKGKWFRRLSAHDYLHIDKALESVGMMEFRDKRIGELSGGQKQRINLARTFASDPDLYILDEPTVGMDEKSRRNFYEQLHHQCKNHNKAVLIITHDSGELAEFADRNIDLKKIEDSEFRCFHIHHDYDDCEGCDHD